MLVKLSLGGSAWKIIWALGLKALDKDVDTYMWFFDLP
jgi:hypothetical protein